MSATILNDSIPISTSIGDTLPVPAISAAKSSTIQAAVVAATADASSGPVEFAKCECCGLTEECTLAYIARVRERYHGRWICGLCAEAAKDEICRSDRLISTEEALNRHMAFCKKFRSSAPPPNPTEHLISAVVQLLRRSLDSPRSIRSTPSSPRRSSDDAGVLPRQSLARADSCFPTLAS